MSLTEPSDCEDVEVVEPQRLLITHKEKRATVSCITPRMVSALDKAKVSDRNAIHILTATALGMKRDPKELIINRSSLQRCRTENRKKIADYVKNNPQVFLKNHL